MPNHVLQLDCTSAGGDVELDLGSSPSDVWIEFDIALNPTCLASVLALSSGSSLNFASSGSSAVFAAIEQQSGVLKWKIGTSTPYTPGTAITSMQFYNIKLHLQAGVNGPSQMWVDGTSIGTDTSVDTSGGFEFTDLLEDIVSAGGFVYFDNFKIGTTDGGSELGSDDFEGGSLSFWNSFVNDATIIVDPGIAPAGGGPSPPVADFTGTPTSGAAPLTVAFTDTSTPGSSGPITAWSWTFGDGGTASTQNPSHVYTVAGTYTVVLVVTGTSPDGTDTKTRTNYITVGSAPTNIDQDDAVDLTPFCSSATISNQFAPDTAAIDDPLNTVYGLGGTFSRQVWYKLTNTSAVQAYARFTITQPAATHSDIAGAIYLDDPATDPLDGSRTAPGDGVEFWSVPLTGGSSRTLGTALEPGQTVWLELAGDDTEGDGAGWNGNMGLQWELLAATFYDAPDDYAATDFAPPTGGTNYRGGLQAPEYGTVIDTLSYAKVGDQHFWALRDNDAGGAGTFLSVWVWTDGGGAPTIYHIDDPSGSIAFGSGGSFWGFGINRPLLRTDGTNLWLVAYTSRTENSPSLCPGTYTAHELVVFLWNGSGFTYLGSDTAKFYPIPGVANYFQVVGDFAAAADSTDVGHLHVAWCEAGPNTCSLNGDSHPATMGSRVSYSKWDTSGVLVQNDALATSTTTPAGTFPTIDGTCLSAYIAITNAYGNPVLFHAPCVHYDPINTGGAGTITYGSILNMYAIDGSGVATLQQSYDITSDFPTQTFDGAVAESTLGVTQRSPQRQLSGQDEILIWALRTPSHTSLHLVVPADGSSAISLLGLSVGNFMEAIIDDDNIWAGAGWSGNSGLGIGLGNASLSCIGSGATFNPSSAPKLVGVTALGFGVSEFFWDDTADCFYTMGWNALSHPSEEYAPIQIPILRDYLICTVGDCLRVGLHIWQRT